MDSGLEEGKTVPRCRESLVSMGLARVERGVIYAKEPEGETVELVPLLRPRRR